MTHSQPVDQSAVIDQYRDARNLDARIDLHRRFSTNTVGWTGWLFAELAIADGAAVLDLGCGEGSLWADNADRLPAAHWTLNDLSPGMLAGTEARLAGVLPGAAYVAADAQDLPFADGAFDVVVANHMLYHIPDIPRAVGEIRRVLRPGGRLCAATNGERHMRELDDLVRRVAPDQRGFDAGASFTLENGAAQLAPFFDSVEQHDYLDGLAVTEPDAVVAYVRSAIGADAMPPDALAAIRADVSDAIERDGAFRIGKSAGVFRGIRRA